ncbi:copper homeostasis membrane protein CopD [Phenylobacterium sp. LjRoot225]|uniref:copper homeostasis membrane protein CopD n=1 Tax=Phenylobacterium sp. LjRoot225 TaxID=3342285 RepID=UPI003ECD4933
MEAAVVLTRLAAFAAGVTLFGAPLFVLYSLPRDADGPSGLRPILIVAALLTVLAAAVGLVVQTGQMAGDPKAGLDPATLLGVLAGGGFGISMAARIAAGLLAVVPLILLRARRTLWGLTAALGALSLAANAWSGHGGADEGAAGVVHALADVIHLLSAGVWLGALAALLMLLSRRAPSSGAVADLHRALKGFSGVGSAAVAVIVASGLANSWFLIGPQHLRDFAASLWGQLLLVKLALFAAMLGFAALNRFRLTPRLEAALAGDPRAALGDLRRSLLLETGAGLAVLALVAVLGRLAPPISG